MKHSADLLDVEGDNGGQRQKERAESWGMHWSEGRGENGDRAELDLSQVPPANERTSSPRRSPPGESREGEGQVRWYCGLLFDSLQGSAGSRRRLRFWNPRCFGPRTQISSTI